MREKYKNTIRESLEIGAMKHEVGKEVEMKG
jgi:hypothetical protein